MQKNAMGSVLLGLFWLSENWRDVPSSSSYDASVHLSCADISVDNTESPTIIMVRIKASKTDPFRRGVDLYLGKTGSDICPVSAMLRYLCVRGTSPGLLFHFSDGRLLIRQRFVEALRHGLKEAGMDQQLCCGHSLRIGAVTTAYLQYVF